MRSSRRRRRSQAARVPQPATILSTSARLEQVAWTTLVAGLVLVSSTAFDIQFTLPKMLALRFVAPALLLLWIWRHTHGGVPSLPASVLATTVCLAAWWVLITVTAVHRPTSLEGAHGRFNGLWTHLLYLTLFALPASSSMTRRAVDARLRVLVGVLAVAGAYALVQYVGWAPIGSGHARPESTIGNPVPLAACLGLGIPFAVAFAARHNGLMRTVWIAAALLLMFAAQATGSRGPLVGILTSLAVMMWIVAEAFHIRRRTVAIVAVIVAALMISATSRIRSGNFLPSLTALVGGSSSQDRANSLGAALRVARQHPLLGVGFENFSIVYPRYRTADADRFIPDQLPTMVHSGYVQTAATTGLPGLLLYVGLVGSVLVVLVRAFLATSERDGRLVLAAFLASLAGYLVADLTGWEEVSLTGLFWMVLGLGLAAARSPERLQVSRTRWHHAALGVAAGWAVVIVVLAFRLTTVAGADQLFREARELSGHADWSVERDKVEQGLELARNSADYVDAAAVRYAVRFGVTGEQELYNRAARLFETAHQLNPFGEYFLLHRIDLETAALQKHGGAPARGAEDAAATVESGDWHNATAYQALARFSLANRAFPTALDLIGRAKALRPQMVEYLVLEGEVYRAMHLLPQSIAAYRAAVSGANPGSPLWVDAERRLTLGLLETGDAEAAIVHARDLIVHAPDDEVSRQLLSLAEAEVSKARNR